MTVRTAVYDSRAEASPIPTPSHAGEEVLFRVRLAKHSETLAMVPAVLPE